MVVAPIKEEVDLACPHCGSKRFTEIRDCSVIVRYSREHLPGQRSYYSYTGPEPTDPSAMPEERREEEPWNHKYMVKIADWGSSHYMMSCDGCGANLEPADLVEKFQQEKTTA